MFKKSFTAVLLAVAVYCCTAVMWAVGTTTFYSDLMICITATVFAKPDDNYFGIQLRLVSIPGNDHF